ncbi:MAG: DUF2752 domain-containing protein [Flavobacteriaceae bacterium]
MIFLVDLMEINLLPCLNKQVLGVDCPGCGLQRSVLLLFDGDFSGAFYMFPALYPMMLLLLFLLADQFIKIKYANSISIILMISTVTLILTNFLYKLL